MLCAVLTHSSLCEAKYFGDQKIRHSGAMPDVTHGAFMVALVPHVLRGDKKFVRVNALDYILDGKSLNSLLGDALCWCQLRCCLHLEMETENRPFCLEKAQRFPMCQQNVVASGGLSCVEGFVLLP
jgi:hypothetical protein